MPSQPFDRSSALQNLENSEFDMVVVGGGITGAGVALDAASRGLRVALLERDDFASGTSSKLDTSTAAHLSNSFVSLKSLKCVGW